MGYASPSTACSSTCAAGMGHRRTPSLRPGRGPDRQAGRTKPGRISSAKIVGHDGGLAHQVDQAKASVLLSPYGLHTPDHR